MRNLIIEDINKIVDLKDVDRYKNTTLFFTTGPDKHDGLQILEVVEKNLWDKFSDEDLVQAYKWICRRYFTQR